MSLTASSQNYSRDVGTGSGYYYQAIEILVPVSGTYTFQSATVTSLDTHGYLYQGNFYPTYPQYNKLADDDDGVTGTRNFRLTVALRSDIKYIVVATTHQARMTGSFLVDATGPATVTMNPIVITT